MRVLLVSANREMLPGPVVPIGVLSIAAAVEDAHDVRVVDLCFEDAPVAAASAAAAAFAPDVVGLGLRNLHDNSYGDPGPLLAYYEDVGRALRGATRAPLVLGGAAITLQPAAMLERLGAAHAVVGEGELAFRALCDAVARGEPAPRVVRGPAALPRAEQLVRLRARPGGFAALDDLPEPARRHIDPRYFEHEGTDSVQTKRGCAFQCTYCDYPDLEGRKVRVRDPVRVAEEIARRARAPGVACVFLVDSVFNVPRSHALAVCRELAERGAPVPWVAYVTPAALEDELARAMAEAGCVGVEIGTDSGTPRVLERLRKPFSLDDVLRAARALRSAGIADCHTFVLGAEGETPEEASATLAFVDELDPDVAVFVVFMEDREAVGVGQARHRAALLELLAREAPRRPGWVVPELGVRFGRKLTSYARRARLRGPAWLDLARARRGRARA